MIYNVNLPESEALNIAALSGIFSDTTNSYKYIYFLSLLDILERRLFDVSEPVKLRELTIEMLANSWYPHTYFKLSFGSQDKITEKLDAMSLQVTDSILKFNDPDKRELREIISKQKLDSSLERFVPFRILRTFFEKELKGVKDHVVNARVKEFSSTEYDMKKPFYKFNIDDAIVIHPDWAKYFAVNYAIVRGWVAWEWFTYMQRCNSNVPAVGNKLFPPQERASLAEQKKYWNVVLENAPVHCIFSKKPITEKAPPLDHYLPWSFVAHDQLWNLIPTLSSVNSSKSNNLPSGQYHRDFVQLQHLSLVTTHQHFTEQVWTKYVEHYIMDLKIMDKNDLLNLEVLQNAYQPLLTSLLSLASRQGFSPDWTYR
jgi:hypothetical protein